MALSRSSESVIEVLTFIPRTYSFQTENQAEACSLKAIEIAQKQQAKSLEPRATVSLARLWRQQALQQRAESKELGANSKAQETRSRLDEAYGRLSAVYNWFTEGFDTKDLQEAKALLKALSSA